MDRYLLDYLPMVLKEIEEIKMILGAEQTELSNLWNDIKETFRNQFVADAAKNGISRWENILNIKPKMTDDLDARKFRIISRLNESPPYTMTTLKQMLEILCGEEGYFVELDNESYTLVVKIALTAKSNYDDVKLLLQRVIPANMVVELSLKYNQYDTLARFMHEELCRYTQIELRNEVLNHAGL